MKQTTFKKNKDHFRQPSNIALISMCQSLFVWNYRMIIIKYFLKVFSKFIRILYDYDKYLFEINKIII